MLVLCLRGESNTPVLEGHFSDLYIHVCFDLQAEERVKRDEEEEQQQQEDLKCAELVEQDGYRVQGFRKRGTGVVPVPAASDALLAPAPALERLVRGMLPAEISYEQAGQRLAMHHVIGTDRL